MAVRPIQTNAVPMTRSTAGSVSTATLLLGTEGVHGWPVWGNYRCGHLALAEPRSSQVHGGGPGLLLKGRIMPGVGGSHSGLR